jgi:hypothetical protein
MGTDFKRKRCDNKYLEQRAGRDALGACPSNLLDCAVGVGFTRLMSKTFRALDVAQSWPLPPSVHEFVPAGHLSHFVCDTLRRWRACSNRSFGCVRRQA